MVEKIRYIGLRNLDSFEISKIQSLTNKYFKKIERFFSNANLVVNVKKADVGGKRARYEFNLRVEAPTPVLTATHMDWELQRALHRAFDNILNSAKHKYKSEVTQRRKKSFRAMK